MNFSIDKWQTFALVALVIAGISGGPAFSIQTQNAKSQLRPVGTAAQQLSDATSNAQDKLEKIKDPIQTEIDRLTQQARKLEQQNRLQEAIVAFEKIVARHGATKVATHRLAVINDQLGNSKVAEEYYRKAFSLNPTDPNLLCDIGFGSFLRKDFARAELYFKTALQIEPNMYRAHNNLGAMFAVMNQEELAVRHFMAAGNDEETSRRHVSSAQRRSNGQSAAVQTQSDKASQKSVSQQVQSQVAQTPAMPMRIVNPNFKPRQQPVTALAAASKANPLANQTVPVKLPSATKTAVKSKNSVEAKSQEKTSSDIPGKVLQLVSKTKKPVAEKKNEVTKDKPAAKERPVVNAEPKPAADNAAPKKQLLSVKTLAVVNDESENVQTAELDSESTDTEASSDIVQATFFQEDQPPVANRPSATSARRPRK